MKSNEKPKRESGSQKNLPYFTERNPSKIKNKLSLAARTFGPAEAPILNLDEMTQVNTVGSKSKAPVAPSHSKPSRPPLNAAQMKQLREIQKQNADATAALPKK